MKSVGLATVTRPFGLSEDEASGGWMDRQADTLSSGPIGNAAISERRCLTPLAKSCRAPVDRTEFRLSPGIPLE